MQSADPQGSMYPNSLYIYVYIYIYIYTFGLKVVVRIKGTLRADAYTVHAD